MILVSPFSVNPNPDGPPMVCSDVFDHTSLLRLCETLFAARIQDRYPATGTPPPGTPGVRPGLSAWRRAAVGDLTSAFNFAAGPKTFSISTLPLTNRADPRVLAQCTLSGTTTHFFVPSTPASPVPPPSSPQQLPAQEMAMGNRIVPSGPAPNQAACPSVTATFRSGVPNTSAGPAIAVEAAIGAAAVIGTWWTARKRAAKPPVAGGSADGVQVDR